MVRHTTRRRQLLTSACIISSCVLAGCLSDDSADDDPAEEADDSMKEAFSLHEEATEPLDGGALETHLDAGEWSECLDALPEIRDGLDDARDAASDAREAADEEDLTEYVDAIDHFLDLIDILHDTLDKVEEMCEAGQDDDHEAMMDALSALEDIDADRESKEAQIDSAFENLEGQD